MTALLPLLALSACLPEKADDTGAAAATDMTELEQAVHDAINDHRESIGLNRLVPNQLMLDLARGHSADMASGAVPFSHEGFEEERAPTIISEVGVQSVGENVAYLYNVPDPVGAAVQGWLDSEGHRANIEGSYDLTGLGASEVGEEIYLTQLFALSF